MASGKKRGKGADWGRWEHGSAASWLGRRRGWLDDHCYRMYCVGADQETAKGGPGAPTRTLNLATLMRSQGEWYSILVQSPPFNLSHICSFACASPPNLAGAGLPELWGCASRNEVPLRCRRPVELRQGDCWDSSPLPGGKHFPLSHFPGDPVDPDRPPPTGSSHLSALCQADAPGQSSQDYYQTTHCTQWATCRGECTPLLCLVGCDGYIRSQRGKSFIIVINAVAFPTRRRVGCRGSMWLGVKTSPSHLQPPTSGHMNIRARTASWLLFSASPPLVAAKISRWTSATHA